MVSGQMIVMTPSDFGQLNCSILLGAMKAMVRKLRHYGVDDAAIEAVLHEEEVLSELYVTKDYRILVGENRVEVRMEPLVKSVYLLFLSHPEGIVFKDLPDYREELSKIYVKLKPYGMSDRVVQSIEDVTNPLLNSINDKCARIRKAFINVMDSKAVEPYIIKGMRGGIKKIDLPRDLVVWKYTSIVGNVLKKK